MLNYLDMDVSMIEEVYVAGGIGSGINMKNAVTIGMFPDIPLEKFHYIGNSSLTCAYSTLLSPAAEKKTYAVARNMTYLELSTVPTYMDEFVAACFLPHTDTTMFPSVGSIKRKQNFLLRFKVKHMWFCFELWRTFLRGIGFTWQ